MELHYFARAEDHLAFQELRDQLANVVTTHLGLDPKQTGERLREVLGAPADSHHVYVCGPGPMLDAARATANELGWPDSSVHFEYFNNAAEVDQSSTFHVDLARTATTLTVGPGESILDALHQAGVAIASSCEQGACGTCVATVLDGTPDHQDVRLSAKERAEGKQIMTCVSRSLTDRLVLDL